MLTPVEQAEHHATAANAKVEKLRTQLDEALRVAEVAEIELTAARVAAEAVVVSPDPAQAAGGSSTPGE